MPGAGSGLQIEGDAPGPDLEAAVMKQFDRIIQFDDALLAVITPLARGQGNPGAGLQLDVRPVEP